MDQLSHAETMNNPVLGSKLGERKFVAPPSSGAIRRPSGAGSLSGLGIGRTFFLYTVGPVHRRKGVGEQTLSVGAVEHKEIAIARSLHRQLPWLALEVSVYQHWNFDCVPIVGVVWRWLEGPCQLSCVRIERQDAACIKVISRDARARSKPVWDCRFPGTADSDQDRKFPSPRSCLL